MQPVKVSQLMSRSLLSCVFVLSSSAKSSHVVESASARGWDCSRSSLRGTAHWRVAQNWGKNSKTLSRNNKSIPKAIRATARHQDRDKAAQEVCVCYYKPSDNG